MTKERRNHRSSNCLRTEPESIEALVKDKSVMEAFKKIGCWRFCEKLQGGHSQVSKEFALHFTGSNTKIGILNLEVTPENIALVTEIPRDKIYGSKISDLIWNHVRYFLSQSLLKQI